MYNPEGNDNNREFIEIYHDPLVNLTGYIVGDLLSNDTLVCIENCEFPVNSNYSLIVEEDFDFSYYLLNLSDINGSVYSAGSTIGNNLNNDIDTIFLYDYNSTLIASASYNCSAGADGDGNSLNFYNGSWCPKAPTPLYKNTLCTANDPGDYENHTENFKVNLKINLNPAVILNKTYDSLFKIEIKDKDCSLKDNVTVMYGIYSKNLTIKSENFTVSVGCTKTADTGSWIPQGEGVFKICGSIYSVNNTGGNFSNESICTNLTVINTQGIECNISLNIETDKNLYDNDESIKYNINLIYENSTAILTEDDLDFEIEYRVDDVFGSSVQQESITKNTNQKSFSKTYYDDISGDRAFLIKARLIKVNCNDTTGSDNYAEKLVVVKGAKPRDSIEIIKVLDLYEGKARFGWDVRAEVEISKESDDYEDITLWIEKGSDRISSESRIRIKSPGDYTLTVPIQIDSNCDEKLAGGNYDLVAEGLGDSDSENIRIEGISPSVCKTSVSGGGDDKEDKDEKNYNDEKELEEKNEDEVIIRLLNFEISKVSGEIYCKVDLINNFQEDKTFKIYSYAYSGGKCLSQGLGEDSKWRGGWLGNARVVSVPAGSSAVVELRNKIEPGFNSEEYEYEPMFRVRAADVETEKKYDKTIDFDIEEHGVENINGKLTHNNNNLTDIKIVDDGDDSAGNNKSTDNINESSKQESGKDSKPNETGREGILFESGVIDGGKAGSGDDAGKSKDNSGIDYLLILSAILFVIAAFVFGKMWKKIKN